jgi:mannose-1-phosphate guanylyltransferase
MQKDLNGNVSIGAETQFSDSRNCIVNVRGANKVVVIGIDDCIIAENEGNILVCRLSDDNRVKEFSDVK